MMIGSEFHIVKYRDDNHLEEEAHFSKGGQK